MKQNSDLSIGKFTILGFSLIIGLFVLVGGISWKEISSLRNLTSTIYNHPLEVSNAALRASRSVIKMHRNMKDVVLVEDGVQFDADIVHVTAEERIVYRNLDLIQKKILGVEGQLLVRETRKLFIDWKPIREEVIDHVKSGNILIAARITKGKGAEHELLLEQKMSELALYARRKADSFMDEANTLQQRATLLTGSITVTGAFLAVIIAFFTTTRITKAFRQQKRAEDYLRESEKKFKDFMMSGTDGVVFYDSKFNLIEINDKALEIFPPGTDRDKILGKHVLEISPGLKGTERYSKYLEVMKTGQSLILNDVVPDPVFGERHLDIKAFQAGAGLGFIFSDITERVKAEQTLRESEFFFSQLFKQSTTSTCLYNPEGIIIRANSEFCRMFGVEEKMITDGRFNVFEDQPTVDAGVVLLLREIFDEKKSNNWETNYDVDVASESTGIPTSRKGQISLEVFGYPIVNNKDDLKYVVLQHYDISERKQAEEQIRASLKEKETLLQEIHHRVKNNMAVISSLLKLQANGMKDERLKDALMDSQSRIQSMSAIHETLYQSENLSSIDLNTYLSKLTRAVSQNFTTSTKVKLKIEAKSIIIEVKQASPIGLIINELIMNSFKHAFPDNQEGEIIISLQKTDDQIELTYKDNGIGIPRDFDWYNTKSMGLNLVKILSEGQLAGSVELNRDQGTCFVIKFSQLDNSS